MKIGRNLPAWLLACLLLLAAIVPVAAQSEGTFDLAITAIDPQPLVATIGEDITFFITFQNLSPNPIPLNTQLDLVLTATNSLDRKMIAQCRQPLDLSGITSADDPQRLPFPNCSIVFNDPATHLIRAEFVAVGEPVPEGPYYTISGDIDPSNNGSMTSLLPTDPVYYDSLPADLTRIFAGLAIFFAVMALIAAGTEVTIDSLKVAIGLKRKVTSMEALERMEKYLPGELATLSVSSATREQFRRMVQEMRSTLDTTLARVTDFTSLRSQVANGIFGEAYRRIEAILPDNGEMSQQDVYNFKKYLHAFINKTANAIENQLLVNAQTIKPLRDQLAQEISLFDGTNSAEFLAEIFDQLQDAHFWSTQITGGWLNAQEATLFEKSSTAVLGHFDTDVQPLLLGVGFAPNSVEHAKRELASQLRIIETGISQATDTFVSSIRNVLDGVELRRYETQSPARKVWRILRGWYGGVFPPVSLTNIIVPSSVLALFALYITWLFHLMQTNTITTIISNVIPVIQPFPWLPWLILYFCIFLFILFLLHIFRKSRGTAQNPWFIGLYGVFALAFIVSAILLLILWLLQPTSFNRVSGQLAFFSWTQPWWSWLVMFAVCLIALMLISGQIGKYVYDHLVESAVLNGRLASNQRKLDFTTVLHRIETFWNLLRNGFDITRVDPDKFNQAESVSSYEQLSEVGAIPEFTFSADTTAQFIMARTDQQRDEESSRLRLLRVISIVIGLILAYVLQIDVLNLLGEAFPGALESLNITLISGATLHSWRSWLPVDKAITVGIVLTGFAASAGSAFWHDRLDKLQASKKGAQAAAQLLSQASQVANTVGSNRDN